MIIEPGASLAGDRYELRSRIGTGGMASVWLAHDTRLDRPVAIKIPADHIASDPRFSRRFEREARIAASLSHPNLVPIYDYGVESGRAFLVMEHVAGESLAERLERGQRIDARSLAVAMLGAVAHMHSAGVIHRDIKPDNILIKPSGRVLMTDFGIAQITDATQLTGTGQVLGTLRYIAPEIMAGERASARSDLYSCGIVLRDCLEDDDGDADLRALIDSLSASDPADRPADASAALASVSAGARGDATGAAALRDTSSAPTTAMPTAPMAAPTAEWSPDEPTASSALRPAAAAHTSIGPGSGRPIQPRLVAMAAFGLLIAGVVGAFALSGGGEPGNGPHDGPTDGPTTTDAPTTEVSPPEEADATTAETGLPAPTPDPDPTRGAELNDQGFALLGSGDYQAAVPILAEALAAFPLESTDGSDINYVFALFNYGRALRLSGDPEAAIPVLEKRLEFDNQTDVVRAELDLARAEAAGAPKAPKESKEPKESKQSKDSD